MFVSFPNLLSHQSFQLINIIFWKWVNLILNIIILFMCGTIVILYYYSYMWHKKKQRTLWWQYFSQHKLGSPEQQWKTIAPEVYSVKISITPKNKLIAWYISFLGLEYMLWAFGRRKKKLLLAEIMVQFNKNEALSVFRRLSLKNDNWNSFKEHFSYLLSANSSVNEATDNFYNNVLSANKFTIPVKTRRRSLAPLYLSSQSIHLENKLLTTRPQKCA